MASNYREQERWKWLPILRWSLKINIPLLVGGATLSDQV
jgi:hypothetical protein